VNQAVESFLTQARFAEQTGSSEFTFRLDPPELGRVEVRLTLQGSELKAEVNVADDRVLKLFERQLPELQSKLEDAGVSIKNFDLSSGNSGSPSQQQQNNQEKPPPPAFPFEWQFADLNEEGEPRTDPSPFTRSESRLNIVA
jgi:flagellar hook-length control protein FliK